MELYTADQVAKKLGISVVTVRWRARNHKVGRKFGRAHMFTAADIETLRACPSPGRPKKKASARVARA